MTTVYFVRHAQPNYNNHEDALRELTPKGLRDRISVSRYLHDKKINAVLSSPYKRAFDTVKDFADKHHLPVETIDDFRERKVDRGWIENFDAFCRQQWEDFSYRLSDGESLGEVQERNIRALYDMLEKYKDKNIVIGSHGTALCTIIHYFDPAFGYDDFVKIKSLMPWIVRFVFEDKTLLEIERISHI